jgi:thymidylate kinase
LDIDPKEGLKSATDPNRFEQEGVLFQAKVRKGFLSTIRKEPKRWIKLKAKSAAPEQMANTLWTLIQKHPRCKKKLLSL